MFRTIILTVFAVLLFSCIAAAVPQGKDADEVAATATEGVIVRGEKIGESPLVSMDAIAKDPERYMDKKIVVEGTIETVCQKKGCWMTLEPVEGRMPMRVTFHNYGFFVPKDAAGLKVRAEGRIKVTTLSKEDVEHLKEEGSKISCKHDGTADEIGFVATGVEIFKKDE